MFASMANIKIFGKLYLINLCLVGIRKAQKRIAFCYANASLLIV